MYTVPSFTINKKEFFTLWVKQYVLTLQLDIFKQTLLQHKDKLQATNFKTQVAVNFEESDDINQQFLIYNNITSSQKLKNDFEQIQFIL